MHGAWDLHVRFGLRRSEGLDFPPGALPVSGLRLRLRRASARRSAARFTARLREVFIGACIGRTSTPRVADRIAAMKAFLVFACTGLALALGRAAAADTPATESPAQVGALQAHVGGIWKAAVPGRAMEAEFDRYDAYGLAIGARIQADCSLNWIDPDDGRRYCFASGTSLVYFLERPKTYLAQARGYWQRLPHAGH